MAQNVTPSKGLAGDGDPVATLLRDGDLGQLRLRLLLRRACTEELAPLDAGAVAVAEAVAALLAREHAVADVLGCPSDLLDLRAHVGSGRVRTRGRGSIRAASARAADVVPEQAPLRRTLHDARPRA